MLVRKATQYEAQDAVSVVDMAVKNVRIQNKPPALEIPVDFKNSYQGSIDKTFSFGIIVEAFEDNDIFNICDTFHLALGRFPKHLYKNSVCSCHLSSTSTIAVPTKYSHLLECFFPLDSTNISAISLKL